VTRKSRLSVACIVDQELFGKIKAADTTHNEAKYDVSVIKALRTVCREVHVIAAFSESSRTIDELTRLRPDVLFNLAFSAHPLEASFAGCLDILGIPYTGSGPLAIALANDKVRSRYVLRSAGVLVPRFVEVDPRNMINFDLKPPLIVKPASLAGSAGIHDDSVVTTKREVLRLAGRIWRRFQVSSVCDEFIIGPEYRVGMIESAKEVFEIIGISEWKFPLAAPGMGFKTEAIRTNRKVRSARGVSRALATLGSHDLRELTAVVRRAVKALDVRGYATIDVRIDALQRVIVLEVNANPGLWSGSAIWGNPSFEGNIKRILSAPLKT
jgi:D-alanine-D-alanine ligase